MICRVCLVAHNTERVIHIFQDVGVELDVAGTVAKYFWFEPKSDDPISTVICHSCWENVLNFHNFYLDVEKAHKLLSERFSLLSVEREPLEVPKFASKLDLEEMGSSEVMLKEEAPAYPNMVNVQEEHQELEEEEYIEDYLVTDFFLDENTSAEEFIEVKDIESDKVVAETPNEENEDSTVDKRLRSQTTTAKAQHRKARQPKPSAADSSDSEIKKKRGRPRKQQLNASPNESQAEGKTDLSKMWQGDEKITQNVRLLCDICGLEFLKFAVLRDHMENSHSCKGYAICCRKKFYKRTLLIDHVEKHLNPNCHKCDDCNKEFADKQCLRNHRLLKHQTDEEKPFQCEHCPKRFAKPYFLAQHKVIHSSRTHNCDLCEKGFPTSPLLRAHFKTKHQNFGTMCDICAKVVRGRAAFEKHQLEHEGVSPPRVQCDTCGSWHKDKHSLQKHKRRHNAEGTLHVCSYCDKVAPNRSALLSHQRYVHLNSARNFKCSVCSKAFKRALNLREHMATHTGEVLYKCPYCVKTFNSNANMHSHRKKMHPKEFEETRQQRRQRAGIGQPLRETTSAETFPSSKALVLGTSELPETTRELAE